MMKKTYNAKHVELNLKDGIAYISSSSLTVMGLFMSTPPFLKLEWNKLQLQEKFDYLQQAIDGSIKDVPMPENPKEYSQLIMKDFGFKSWEKFCENGCHCTIVLDLEKREYQINPMVYVKEQRSLFGAKTGSVTLSNEATPEELITTLEKVLDKIPQLTEEYYANEDISDD